MYPKERDGSKRAKTVSNLVGKRLGKLHRLRFGKVEEQELVSSAVPIWCPHNYDSE